MRQEIINGLWLWQFENLSKEKGIKHYVSDRNTIRNGKEFTLSLSSTPDKELVINNRRMLAETLGVLHTRSFYPSQVHETKIHRVTSDTKKEDLKDTDALICNER